MTERGAGVLLVEHDVPLVREVCDYLYVMDFGVKIFEGTPEEALGSPLVQTAYLGSEGVEQAIDNYVKSCAAYCVATPSAYQHNS